MDLSQIGLTNSFSICSELHGKGFHHTYTCLTCSKLIDIINDEFQAWITVSGDTATFLDAFNLRQAKKREYDNPDN